MSLLIRAFTFARSRLARHASLIDPESVASVYHGIWKEAAAELGAEIGSLGNGFCEIRRNGNGTRLRENLVMLDHPVGVALARDKAIAYELLARAGLPVPEHLAFQFPRLAPALRFLAAGSLPCVVKPGRGTSGGDGVTLNVTKPSGLRRAALHAAFFTRSLLIERQIEGNCYRLLYLDGELLDALIRRPPTVMGDGRSTLRELIGRENARRGRDRGISATKRITITPDCHETLRRGGWSLRSVPPAGVTVPVKSASNESSDLDCDSVRDEVGHDLAREGAKAAAVLGVRLAGLDVITLDPGVSLRASGGRIIEVNATPGLQYHYQTRDPARRVPVAVPILARLLETPAATARSRTRLAEPASEHP